MPYNYICVQAGTILNQLHSMDEALDQATLIKLAVIAIVALCPAFFKKKIHK